MKLVHVSTGGFSGPPVFECPDPNPAGVLHLQYRSGVPTYDECRQMIREEAHRLWEAAGRPPARDVEFWLRAELDLFFWQECHLLFGGYRVYVLYPNRERVEGYYTASEVGVVAPHGYFPLTAGEGP